MTATMRCGVIAVVATITSAMGCDARPSTAPEAALAAGTSPVSTSSPVATAATGPASTGPASMVTWAGADTAELAYIDVSGQQRSIVAQIRRPAVGHTRAAPVLVWSHGGGDGKDAVGRVGDGWSRAFTEAGYVVVAIAHSGRDLDSRRTLCAAIGVASCETFLYLTWDRPNDARVVFDWLEQLVVDGEPFDLDRLAYGGHSSGTTSVLTIGGLTGTVPGDRQPPTDPRPRALLAASAPGAETQGFDEASFAALDRPVIVLTGIGDDTDGAVGTDRRATFDLFPAGDGHPAHRLVWGDDARARHTTFDLDLDACRRAGASRATCRQIVRGLADAAVAYLSAALDGDLVGWQPPRLSPPLSWVAPA